MKKTITEFKNRDGDILTFVRIDDVTVFMTGYHSLQVSTDDNKNILSVDPSGGPYISQGTELFSFVDEPAAKIKGITVQVRLRVLGITITHFGVIFNVS